MKDPTHAPAQPAGEAPLPDAIRAEAAAWKARADAGLSADANRELQAWLDGDPRHRAAMDRFDQVWDRFDRPSLAGASEALVHELAMRAGRRTRRRAAAAAAGLVMLVAVGTMWHVSPDAGPGAGGRDAAIAAAPAKIVMHRPARKVLPDGSVVELNDGAEIAERFSAGVRRVILLRGEAHFEVKSHPLRPFVVAVGDFEARAMGTAFSVQLSTNAVAVLVTEGRVAVNQTRPGTTREADAVPGATPTPPPPLAVLDVGKRLEIEQEPTGGLLTRMTEVDTASIDERLAWRALRVEFTRTPLSEVVAMVNGYAAGRKGGEDDPQLIIEDPSVAQIRVSGIFRINRIEAFVGLLQGGFGIEAESRGGNRWVLVRAR